MKPEQLLTHDYSKVREIGRLLLNPKYQSFASIFRIKNHHAYFKTDCVFNIFFSDKDIGIQQFGLAFEEDGCILVLEYVANRYIPVPHPSWRNISLEEVFDIFLIREQFYPPISEDFLH